MPNRKISEVMRDHPLITVDGGANVRTAAQSMADHHVAALAIIADDGGLEGILTERDVIQRVVAGGLDPESTTVEQVMTARPITIEEDHTVRHALGEMHDNQLRHLPVTRDGRVVGMVSIRDFVGAEIAELDHERDLEQSIWERTG